MATKPLDDKEAKTTKSEFDEVVNMSASAIEKWLKTDKSTSVGQTKEVDDESIGHKSGERIIKILEKTQSDLTDDDYAHMRKVVSYVKRHRAQEPKEVKNSNWEFSLKNWGHDPSKK